MGLLNDIEKLDYWYYHKITEESLKEIIKRLYFEDTYRKYIADLIKMRKQHKRIIQLKYRDRL